MKLKSKTLIKEKLKKNKKELVLWATDCAEHVLPYFEKQYPKDDRPRKAIETAKAWVRGEININPVRIASLASHAAARKADKDNNSAARAAARSAGQAVATCHAVLHCIAAANYAIKVFEETEIMKQNIKENIKQKEYEWQYNHLPKKFRLLIKLKLMKDKKNNKKKKIWGI